MFYVLVENNNVKRYPYTVQEFRADHPHISLPQEPSDSQLNEVGLHFVVEPALPNFDYMTEKCIKEDLPTLSEGVWTISWKTVKKTKEEIDNDIFIRRDSMVVSPLQAKIALQRAGLLDSVEKVVSNGNIEIKLAWNNATEFRRLSPIIQNLATELNLSDEQLDNLFASAMTIIF